MTMKPLTILCLTIALLSFYSNACEHDNMQIPIKHFSRSLTDHSSGRMLASTDNIRIAVFYHLDNLNVDFIKKAISQQIMPAVVTYYQSALKVKRLTETLSMSSTETQYCAGVDVQTELANGVDADLVLLVTVTRDPTSSYIASASACYVDTDTNRPLVGHVKYNIAYGFDDDTEFNFQTQLYITLHEVGHVLGFSAGLYDLYIDPNTNTKLPNPVITKTVNGVSQYVLTVEPLRTKLRDYFGCPTLEGAYIEQQGGSGSTGSHFERRIFMNELMTASATIDTRVSEFFLALLEGTGWYTPDYDMAEPVFWGKGQGCDFLDTKCVDSSLNTAFPEHFCTTLDVDMCTFSKEAYAVCGTTNANRKSSSLNSAFNYWGDNTVVLDRFADNCPYYFAYTSTECKDATNSDINLPGGEYFGAESNCFTGTLNYGSTIPFCLKNTVILFAILII